jgi:hypothetical protein
MLNQSVNAQRVPPNCHHSMRKAQAIFRWLHMLLERDLNHFNPERGNRPADAPKYASLD